MRLQAPISDLLAFRHPQLGQPRHGQAEILQPQLGELPTPTEIRGGTSLQGARLLAHPAQGSVGVDVAHRVVLGFAAGENSGLL